MTGLALGNPFGNIFEGAYDLEIAKDNVRHIKLLAENINSLLQEITEKSSLKLDLGFVLGLSVKGELVTHNIFGCAEGLENVFAQLEEKYEQFKGGENNDSKRNS